MLGLEEPTTTGGGLAKRLSLGMPTSRSTPKPPSKIRMMCRFEVETNGGPGEFDSSPGAPVSSPEHGNHRSQHRRNEKHQHRFW